MIFKVKFEVTQMNLTSLINKSAKALALIVAFVAAPFWLMRMMHKNQRIMLLMNRN